MTDGRAIIPLLGFEVKQKEFLEQLMKEGATVSLKNCLTNFNRKFKKQQVVVESHTAIERAQSIEPYKIENITTLGSPLIALEKLSDFDEYDRVTVQITVLVIKKEETIKMGKRKQELVVADETSSTILKYGKRILAY